MRRLLVSAITLTAGCVSARPVDLSPLDPPTVRSLARLLSIADTRDPDTTTLLSAWGDSSVLVRREAVLAAGQVGATHLAPRLRSLLTDPDSGVAANAAFSLGLLHDTASVAALADALGAQPSVAAAAAWSLGELGRPGQASLLAALRAPLSNATPAILIAAASLRPIPVPDLVPWLRVPTAVGCEPYHDVVWAATYSLTRARQPAAVRALIAVAASPCAEVRATAARGLARPSAGDSLAPLAVPILRTLTRDPAPHVRIMALGAIASYGDSASDAVEHALTDSDPNVRLAAVQAMGPATPKATWERAWAADTGTAFRSAVLDSAMSKSHVHLPALESWKADPDWRRRAASAVAAGRDPDVAGTLGLSLVHDPDGRVRSAAIDATASLSDSGVAGIDWNGFGKALSDPDVYVRASALAALPFHLKPAQAVSRALVAYRAALNDHVSDARLAALALIQAAWQHDSLGLGDSVRRAIVMLPVPADPVERAAGARLPVSKGWANRVGIPRPLAWYEDVVRQVMIPSLNGQAPRVTLDTDRGRLTIELYGTDAPLTTWNFISLVRSGYYGKELRFHRVVPDFVAQDGDPRGDGNGSPPYTIRDEINRRVYSRGEVGMALSGPNTGGSQYFLALAPQPSLDGHYTVFGRVVEGLDTLDELVQGDRIRSIRMAQ